MCMEVNPSPEKFRSMCVCVREGAKPYTFLCSRGGDTVDHGVLGDHALPLGFSM